MKNRGLYVKIWRELASDKGMILLSGPCQTGKTTLAQIISKSFVNYLYFNWDIPQHKIRLIKDPAFFETIKRKDSSRPLIVFDEIHKYKDWKNYLKGVYDQFHKEYQFLVSGSRCLDVYQKGGDSLAGRYFPFHLWPFTIAELGECNRTYKSFLKDPLYVRIEQSKKLGRIWSQLSKQSGFPEPFLSNRTTIYHRWSNTYSQQLIREDIRDLTGIKSVGDMETLYLLLPSKVGSPISIPSFAQDLRVSYNSIHSWLSIFEKFFLVFSISPWIRRITRAIQKERKLYLWDTPKIEGAAARFENMIALELWRAVNSWNDMGYGLFSLHYIKNKERQEVDFLIANGRKPFLLIEAKIADTQPSPVLKKFQRVLNIPAVQLINEGDSYRKLSNEKQSLLIAPAYQWLSRLP
ncbi:MAG: ATP-binding protein [Candidatus Scalindua sp.]